MKKICYHDAGIARASTSGISHSDENDVTEILGETKIQASDPRISFLAKLATMLGIAVHSVRILGLL